MYQINIHEAKTQLSKLVEEAAQGEEIIIAKAGRPVARLVPLATNEGKTRTPGGMKSQILLADDFDAPMSDEELALWNDSPIFPKQGQ
ncbi:MAG: type II toxin-antitoxin system Phd/YefM family antitoxin [Methyloglobulus sp.]|nr:type II toxin-antitoxin system Phd/YefM family antitoxin [Methyloglobulus sp.]